MKEYGISEVWTEHQWQKAKKTKLPIGAIIHKEKKYGEKVQNSFSYYRRCGYKFTVKYLRDSTPVLVTITKCYSMNTRIK